MFLQWLHANTAGELIYTFLISMAPIIELRGAIPVGVGMLGAQWIPAIFVVAVLGNMVPVPFIIVYIRRIFQWMRKKSRKMDTIVRKMEQKAHLKGRMVTKYQHLGLLILVAIPLPGTGAWTGALVAAFMDMRLKKAVPVIFCGVVIAGLIVSVLTVGVVSIL